LPWKTSTPSTKRLTPNWCELVTDFNDRNIEILDGEYAGVVFRFVRVGFIPQPNDQLQINFQYDLIHTADFGEEELTAGQCNIIIIEILKEYLELRGYNDVG
jgi:hypothetical protein